MVFRQMRRDSVQIEAGERSSGHAHQGTAEFGAIRCREATAPEGLYFFIPRACTKPKLLVISSSLSEPPPTS